jgi:hypothetical protein
LLKNHGLLVCEPGSLENSLKKGTLSRQLQVLTLMTIREAVQELNLLKRLAQVGTEWFVEYMISN